MWNPEGPGNVLRLGDRSQGSRQRDCDPRSGVNHCSELGADVVGDRPSDDAPREHVEDGAAVDLAFSRRVLGDVGAPQLVGTLGARSCAAPGPRGPAGAGRWRPFRRWQMPWMPAVRINRATRFRPDAMSSAQLQLGVHPRGPVGGSGGGMDLSDLVQQVGVVPVPARRRSSAATRSKPERETCRGPGRPP